VTPGAGEAPPRTITVSGTGRATVRPDHADLRLGVTTEGPDVRSASAANTAAMRAVIAAIKGQAVADADIQTASLALNPVYDYSREGRPPRLTGYSFSNVVIVTIRELGRIGDIVDAAVEAGATTIEGLAFRVSDRTAVETAARTAAIRDAAAKAEALASAAGVAVGAVTSIAETSGAPPMPVFKAEAALLARDVGPPVEVGANELSVSVVVTYRIT
jgi:uncharacterized protein YggE